jgi:GTPase
MVETTRAGLVAIVGMPNAGKSSLLNEFIGTKLSIVSPAAQTTRERVVGIDTRDGVQMVFLDTPGIVDPAYLLHHSMLGIVVEVIGDADVVVLLLDGTREPPVFSEEVAEAFRRHAPKVLVTINKVDAAGESQIEALRVWSRDTFGREPLLVSAATGAGLEQLRATIGESLPASPFLYPEDDISTQSVRFFVAELLRETVFEQFQDEVPYSVAARVEEFREQEDPLFIRATVYVERPSQKGILIGKKGEAIRRLGSAARVKIEAFVERRVYLDLWIKVLPKWRKDPVELRRFGFSVPDQKNRNA